MAQETVIMAKPILESKSMGAIFQRKSEEILKNILKFGQKFTKFEYILKKHKWLHEIITQ